MKSFTRRRNRSTAIAMLLTAALFSIFATAALAANLNGDGTIIGTTGSDTINAGNGNDTIYGLGGSDNISAGNGVDVIDAGGTCQAGIKSGVYPKGLPGSQYCQHGPAAPYGSDNISAGSGNDVIYGNDGPNNVSAGSGNDTIYAYGRGNYNVGSGTNTIYAQYSSGDVINCGSKKTTVYAVKGADTISSNCTVDYVAAQVAPHVKKRTTKKHRKHHRR